jgi:uroporphyrinogen-III decarboxylase
MKEEYMTPQERTTAAINLEEPDRVPIAPIVGLDLPATYYGLNIAELHRDPIKSIEPMVNFFDEFGGWEMKVEDYKTITDIGWGKFVANEYIYRISGWTPEEVEENRKKYFQFALKGGEEYNIKRQMGMRTGANRVHPFFLLSLNRSLLKFTQDLYYRPELVEGALDTMTEGVIKSTIAQCKANGGNVVFIPEERAEGAIYPLKIFERFWWPYTKRIVEGLYDAGIISWLHLDQCWDLNIPYFKELPKASCIIDLDGLTDIFRAKEILRDHLCIMSDVPASLFSIGTTEQVEDYVKKLIDKLGVDGGHILSSGCEVPPTCKPENFKTFLNTGKTYQLSKE